MISLKLKMNFDLLNSEQLFVDIERQWFESPSRSLFKYMEEILMFNNSLWFTRYGMLYGEMCKYFGLPLPQLPPRS